MRGYSEDILSLHNFYTINIVANVGQGLYYSHYLFSVGM